MYYRPHVKPQLEIRCARLCQENVWGCLIRNLCVRVSNETPERTHTPKKRDLDVTSITHIPKASRKDKGKEY